MIFVTVGMHTQGFHRLVRKMDEIAGKIDEEVIIQAGHSAYKPRNAAYFDFANGEEIKELCRKARIVVTHGAMSVIDAWEQGTPAIAVPRLRQYGECIDDHQLYLIKELEMSGKVIAAYGMDDLEEALKRAHTKPLKFKKDNRLVNALKGYIAQFGQGRGSNPLGG